MITFTIRPEDLHDPFDSDQTLIGIKDASDCDGTACGTQAVDPETGKCVSTLDHNKHLVVTGQGPKASPRYIPVKEEEL
jgi:hypothetical protein